MKRYILLILKDTNINFNHSFIGRCYQVNNTLFGCLSWYLYMSFEVSMPHNWLRQGVFRLKSQKKNGSVTHAPPVPSRESLTALSPFVSNKTHVNIRHYLYALSLDGFHFTHKKVILLLKDSAKVSP